MLNQELTLFEIPEVKPKKRIDISSSQFTVLDTTLSSIFPTQEESQLQKIKNNLGDVSQELTDDQIDDLSTKFQYLIENWLNEFERMTFQGKTLHEVLGGK